MPELPEVETVRRGLLPVLEGHTIEEARAHRPDIRRALPPDLAARLKGRKIERITRRAKYLLLWLDDGWVLLIHLGMSGRLLLGPKTDLPRGKHDHFDLTTTAGGRMVFNDPRRFGAIDLFAASEIDTYPLLAGLGPEPLGDGLNPKYLGERFAGRFAPLKSLLLDQRVIAGLGNIYVCEALFRAKLDPTREGGTLKPAQLSTLVACIKDVLEEAVKAGGSSLRDYVQVSGELGTFQHSFRVYGREGEPCPGCTCKEGIRRIVQSGRSTFFCQKKQR